MRTLTLISINVILAAWGATPAFAREHACSADVQKFCSSVDAKDWKGKAACLKDHESELSAGCVKVRQKMKERFQARKAEFHQACDADIKSVCSNVPDAKEKPWEIFRCLKNNENGLSDTCKAELKKAHRHHPKKKSA